MRCRLGRAGFNILKCTRDGKLTHGVVAFEIAFAWLSIGDVTIDGRDGIMGCADEGCTCVDGGQVAGRELGRFSICRYA